MEDLTFNTTSGQTIAREMMIAYLNTGTAGVPSWSPIGKRVEDSSAEFDWDSETIRDILGGTYGRLKAPIISQEFDPWDLDGADAAQLQLWNLAIKDHNAHALAAQDMLIVHFYAGESGTPFAERYTSCMIEISEIGGEGGGELSMPITVTYGGERTVGAATRDAVTGVVTYVADTGSGGAVGLSAKEITFTAINDTYQLSAAVIPAGTSVTYTSGSTSVATVSSGGLVTAKGAGNTIITASITVNGVTYTDTCTVIVDVT